MYKVAPMIAHRSNRQRWRSYILRNEDSVEIIQMHLFNSENFKLRSKLRLGHNHGVTSLQPLDSVCYKLVHNRPRALALLNDCSDLAHQEWSGVVHCVVVKVVAHLLKVVLHWQYALAGELLDLVLSVLW